MILILSEELDVSTDKVAAWLYHFNVPFVRINDSENIDILKSIVLSNEKNEISFSYRENKFNLSDFKFIWNRRGTFKFKLPKPTNINNEQISKKVKEHLSDEARTLFDFICYKSAEIPHINDPRVYNINKLIVLDKAIKVGFKIPPTYVVKDLETIDRNEHYITKAIQDQISYWDNEVNFAQYCKELIQKDIEGSRFFYSLFQKRIIKKFEVRVFVFFEKIFSMAIFSQSNIKTMVDYRKYDRVKPNRMVPFKLPEIIENNVSELMKLVNLESGSIDLIFDGKHYYFLEINPAGQFDFVSVLCNYNIEKHIALFFKDEITKNHEISS